MNLSDAEMTADDNWCPDCGDPREACQCPKKDHAAVKLGRKGGAATKGITSEAKKAASRANVAKARAAKQKLQNAQSEATVPNASQAE